MIQRIEMDLPIRQRDLDICRNSHNLAGSTRSNRAIDTKLDLGTDLNETGNGATVEERVWIVREGSIEGISNEGGDAEFSIELSVDVEGEVRGSPVEPVVREGTGEGDGGIEPGFVGGDEDVRVLFVDGGARCEGRLGGQLVSGGGTP